MYRKVIAALLISCALLPSVASARAATKPLSVAVSLLSVKGGYAVQVRSQPGATCSAEGYVATSTQPIMLDQQKVGQSGVVHWQWKNAAQRGAFVHVTCTLQGKSQSDNGLILPPMPKANAKLVLGSTVRNWISVLGTPTASDNIHAGWWYCFYGLTPRITIYDGLIPGTVNDINAGPCRQSALPKAQWLAEAKRYLPADAKAVGVKKTPEGTEYEYVSASLARVFPRTDFTDCNSDPATPGSLSIRLGSPGDKTDTGWQIGVGSCT